MVTSQLKKALNVLFKGIGLSFININLLGFKAEVLIPYQHCFPSTAQAYWDRTELLMSADLLDFVCVFLPPNNASMLFLL